MSWLLERKPALRGEHKKFDLTYQQDESLGHPLHKERKIKTDPHRSTVFYDPKIVWQCNKDFENKPSLRGHQLQTWKDYRNDRFHCPADGVDSLEVVPDADEARTCERIVER